MGVRFYNESYDIKELDCDEDSISFVITHKYDMWIDDETIRRAVAKRTEQSED